MKFMFFLILVSSLVSIQSSEASQQNDQFCNEWAKYIDAFDMVSPNKRELPYSMKKNNGDLIKGGMVLGDAIVFVPEPSEALLKAWPNSKIQISLKEQMSKYYDAKKAYNLKIAAFYKEKGDVQAIKLIQNGAFKADENQIVAFAKSIKETAMDSESGDTIKACFSAYQKLSHERVKERNIEDSKYAGAIRSLNDDLQNCQMGSKISDTNRYNVKTIDEIVDQISKREGSSVVPK